MTGSPPSLRYTLQRLIDQYFSTDVLGAIQYSTVQYSSVHTPCACFTAG